MGKYRRIKSKQKKGKLVPIPHNNRSNAHDSRLVRVQIIEMKDPDNPNKKTADKLTKVWLDGTVWRPVWIKKTIFHTNLTSYEQGRMGMMKKALETKDTNIITKLNRRERKLYDEMIKLKEKKEKDGQDDNKS
jgi:hypothetical protein